MKQNVGKTDQIVRLLIAVVIDLLILFNVLSGTWAIVLGILSVILIVTTLIKFCPLYVLFGVSTKK
jgi:hypothetical protein